MKLSRKIFKGIVLATLITVVFTTVAAAGMLYTFMSSETKQQIQNEALYISEVQNATDGELDLMQVVKHAQNRVTVIDPTGEVVFDSMKTSGGLENHLDRPEVEDAFESGTGESTRDSETFGKKMYYYAVLLDNGNVLRVAAETSSMYGMIVKALPGIFMAILILLTLSTMVAGAITKSIVRPINGLDLDDPLSAKTYDELSPLLTRIDIQNKEMLEQMSAIYDARRENDFITRHMNDGLIMIASDGRLISVNEAAERIFGFRFKPGGTGGEAQSYLSVCRDRMYLTAVKSALSGESGVIQTELDGRVYRISLSSVARDFSSENKSDRVYAVFMFIQDITDSEKTEKLRREFSANVSHELKTPLTTIMGCSEILKSGIAKEEDVPGFISQIHTEAKRLLALIDDVISLSGLDETSGIVRTESVDLFETASDVYAELKPKADEKDIRLMLCGERQVIDGNRRMLHEMIYNLCDNAIKYNNLGGYVVLNVCLDGASPAVIVKDNGIGIPKDEQSRVFERFYRVDKSRSKATGGTGLGLSIVKHAAALNGGEIIMKSEPQKGTEIKVVFR